MAIISAGVIMNLFLGLACFVYAYEMGMDEVPTMVGAVMAGSPAYRAGIRAGDEIVAIDGRQDLNFQNVTLKIRLSGEGQSDPLRAEATAGRTRRSRSTSSPAARPPPTCRHRHLPELQPLPGRPPFQPAGRAQGFGRGDPSPS